MKRALLIPGLGGTEDCWSNRFTQMLGSRFLVGTTRLPDHGDTIGDLACFMMPEDPPDVLIGFSIGAAVVQEMLRTNREAAGAVVLMAPPAGNRFPAPPHRAHDFSDGRGKWSSSMLEMMFTPEWLGDHRDVSEFFPRMKDSISGEILIRQSNAIRNWEGCLEDLKETRTPALVIAGLFDVITPVVHARAVAEAMRGSRLELLETGHGFPWQCPTRTAELILEFAR